MNASGVPASGNKNGLGGRLHQGRKYHWSRAGAQLYLTGPDIPLAAKSGSGISCIPGQDGDANRSACGCAAAPRSSRHCRNRNCRRHSRDNHNSRRHNLRGRRGRIRRQMRPGQMPRPWWKSRVGKHRAAGAIGRDTSVVKCTAIDCSGAETAAAASRTALPIAAERKPPPIPPAWKAACPKPRRGNRRRHRENPTATAKPPRAEATLGASIPTEATANKAIIVLRNMTVSLRG